MNRVQPRDAAQSALIARYRELLGPITGALVGEAGAPVTRAQVQLFQTGTAPDGSPVFALGESPLGNLVADAQLATTDDEQGAVAALMNPGRVRADLFADGGDGFSVLTEGTDRFVGGLDLDAFTAYLTANTPVNAPATNRITVG